MAYINGLAAIFAIHNKTLTRGFFAEFKEVVTYLFLVLVWSSGTLALSTSDKIKGKTSNYKQENVIYK